MRQLGPYSLSVLIGRGGLGAVYKGIDTRTGAQVAVKVLHRSSDSGVASRRLAREFRALREVNHPNIIRVLDAGTDEGTAYLVMELIDGLLLRSWLDARFDDPAWTPRVGSVDVHDGSESGSRSRSAVTGEPPAELPEEADSVPGHRRPAAKAGASDEPAVLAEAARLELNRPLRLKKLRSALVQMSSALELIHSHGLVHRDIKPSNVLVADGGRIKLLDFGLVKDRSGDGDTTATGNVVGTYRYLSPEQARGEAVDERSDLYSLGCLLYEMLCGRPPFMQRQTSALFDAILNRAAPLPSAFNPEVDAGLAALAVWLLSKRPEARPQSASELLRAIG